MGISIRDLDLLTVGMVNDMFSELHRDEEKFDYVATQADMDRF